MVSQVNLAHPVGVVIAASVVIPVILAFQDLVVGQASAVLQGRLDIPVLAVGLVYPDGLGSADPVARVGNPVQVV